MGRRGSGEVEGRKAGDCMMGVDMVSMCVAVFFGCRR